ncbi:MAG: ATP-binding protein, partial [Firmicutes bacterium]|nr:ATP-binding protein [Bacillota bacterium]
MQQKGNLSVNTENLMPIIKKWLYSDRDIFLRELVSNACDAISKLNKIAALGEAEAVEKPEVRIVPDAEAGTVVIEDNGIGMTAEEIEKYINQVAFSGAAEFIEKYEKTGTDGIIGHF